MYVYISIYVCLLIFKHVLIYVCISMYYVGMYMCMYDWI